MNRSNRRKICDESEYLIENISDGKVFRSSSECDQVYPLTISNCSNCVIGSFNAHSTITVNNCNKCIIFLGPTNGRLFSPTSLRQFTFPVTFLSFSSVNVHDCTDCDVMCAAMQFRTRDCHNMFISLFCATQPSIESCSSLQFCPFNFSYPQLEGKFLDNL